MIERKITFDLDLHDLRRRAKQAGVGNGFIPVPFLQLAKRPLLDVDIVDVRGESIAIAASDQDSHLANARLLAILRRRGVNLRSLPSGVLSQIYSIVKAPSLDRALEVLYAASPQSFDEPPLDATASLTLTAAEQRAWDQILDVDEFVDRLLDYAESFLLVGQVDLGQLGDVAIVKIRLIEERGPSDQQSSLFSPDRLGWTPQVQLIPMNGLGRAQRNHVRVFAPAEAVVRAATLSQDEVTISEVRDGIAADGSRAPLDRALFYGSHLSPTRYEMRVELEPTRSPFLVPAALTTGLLTLLLAAAAFLQGSDGRFSETAQRLVATPSTDGTWLIATEHATQANFDAAVTVLAIVPSLVAIYIVRAGEHQLVTRQLTLPRILVLVSAFAAIVAAGATAAAIMPMTLWLVYLCAACVTGLTLVSVLIPILRISLFRAQRRRGRHNRTEPEG